MSKRERFFGNLECFFSWVAFLLVATPLVFMAMLCAGARELGKTKI